MANPYELEEHHTFYGSGRSFTWGEATRTRMDSSRSYLKGYRLARVTNLTRPKSGAGGLIFRNFPQQARSLGDRDRGPRETSLSAAWL